MSKLQSLEMEVRELRGDNDRLNRAVIRLTDESIKWCADRDRVIARLLDGWRPLMNGDEEGWRDIPPGPLWKFSYRDLNVYSPIFEPMSDGEAAIIRAHQEKP